MKFTVEYRVIREKENRIFGFSEISKPSAKKLKRYITIHTGITNFRLNYKTLKAL
jgi:hypothetical protein